MTRVHVTIKISSDDAFELKAQALNNDSRLKKAGIAALKFVGDKRYIVDGEFASTPPASREPQRKTQPDKKMRVTIRMKNPDDAYQLIADYLNEDPRLKQAGILDVKPAKQQIAVPAPVLPKEKPKTKSRGFLKWAIILGVIGIIIAGALILLSPISAAPVQPVQKQPTKEQPTKKQPAREQPTDTAIPFVPPTNTFTSSPVPSTFTPTLEPVLSCQPVQGVITSDILSCRYGPGAVYLYKSAFSKGNKVQVLGRASTTNGTWIYVQSGNGPECWINSNIKYVELDNDVACLDSYYPEKAPAPIFNTSLFPAPANVQADRNGDMVNISWIGYLLESGDRESDKSPRYLLELWTCQGGDIVFTPLGTSEEYADVRDEVGCSEPSHGQVFLAHKDGYIGPSYIPWP